MLQKFFEFYQSYIEEAILNYLGILAVTPQEEPLGRR
jgi:hypothetical protein